MKDKKEDRRPLLRCGACGFTQVKVSGKPDRNRCCGRPMAEPASPPRR